MAGYPPYQWRADGGYLQPTPPPPQVPSDMFMYSNQQMYWPPWQFMPGPIGIYGLAQPTAPQRTIPILPPPPPVEKKEEAKKEEPKKEGSKKDDGKKDDGKKDDKKEEPKDDDKAKSESSKKLNQWGPPTLMPGTNYMFATETLMLHIFKRASKIWLPKYHDKALEFKIFKANTQKTVRQMIEHTMGAMNAAEGAEKCKGWAATECIEIGEAKFIKGTTIEYTSDKAKSTFEACGWNGRRGEDLPPVWIAIHKT
ncbi:hypothetical protein LTR56_006607 [Elasticomyces elasticus]|nr:hypothetical protein LTR56_006607 [Elasticomyces elasticus]KAK3664506.1 hypothetical protein LTR22_004640 [Elasticomyces elasticus]KAK4931773.1 hypothetical protein LTR49_001838 [Elasticomyces elasticus]KAK5762915.1 hypothetical protein LTS12_006902 [Elasticomyces elasticus]